MAGLVLITGGTGHVGFRILREALEQGYNVRAVVRSEAKANGLKKHPLLMAAGSNDRLSYIVVPDFQATGAFDDAVKGVQYIIHVASPLATQQPKDGDFRRFFVEPAIRGTLAVLEAARQAGTVKRIVVTSSTAALYQANGLLTTAESRRPNVTTDLQDSMTAYFASKIAALNESETWVKNEKPGFDVINIHPAFVLGRDDLCEQPSGFLSSTNGLALGIVLGSERDALLNNFCHVDDVARVHVASLDPNIEGNQSFIVSNTGSDGMEWEQANEIVKKHFPDAVKSGTLPANGKMPSTVTLVDNSKTETTFGFKHATYEDCVVSIVGHFLELSEKK